VNFKTGKFPVSDALQYPINNGTGTAMSIVHKGERRKEKKAFGKLVRMVDPCGGVMVLQVSLPGDSKRDETEKRVLDKKKRAAWMRLDECPLRHTQTNRDVLEELASLPPELRQPCGADPKLAERIAGEAHLLEGCPHVEHLAKTRRQRQIDERNRERPGAAERERLEQEQRELHSLQLEAARLQVAEVRAKRGKAK
jgi:hypothetical protein